MYRNEEKAMKDLVGQRVTGLMVTRHDIFLETAKGRLSVSYYEDCCNDGGFVEMEGEPDELIGAKIGLVDVVTDEVRFGRLPEWGQECGTWTYVKIQTDKGDLTAWYYGTSNGYYTEIPDVEWRGVDE